MTHHLLQSTAEYIRNMKRIYIEGDAGQRLLALEVKAISEDFKSNDIEYMSVSRMQ